MRQARKPWKGGRLRVNEATSSTRVNWTNPLLWPQIHNTAVAIGFPWRPIDIVRQLQHQDPITFASLRPQRISQWRDKNFPDELKWTESHLRAVARGNSASTISSSRSVLVSDCSIPAYRVINHKLYTVILSNRSHHYQNSPVKSTWRWSGSQLEHNSRLYGWGNPASCTRNIHSKEPAGALISAV